MPRKAKTSLSSEARLQLVLHEVTAILDGLAAKEMRLRCLAIVCLLTRTYDMAATIARQLEAESLGVPPNQTFEPVRAGR